MEKNVGLIDGWWIRQRPDGRFGVYDGNVMREGPFVTAEEAMAAALKLPHPAGITILPRIGLPVRE